LQRLRDNANYWTDPNNYDLEHVAPGFIPTEGERIAGEWALGLTRAVFAAPEAGLLTTSEALGVAVAYGSYRISEGFSANDSRGGIAYVSTVVTIAFSLAFVGAPGVGFALTSSFDTAMGYIEYACVRTGGC
jgi:hypothetical protein